MDRLTQAEYAALPRCPLLQGLTPEAIRTLLDHPEALVDFSPDQVVYSPHHFRRSLGILLSGRLVVTKGSLSVSFLEPGNLFGAAALYSDDGEFVTTITAKRPSRCLLLSQERVDLLLAQDPQIRENYLRYLTGRIRFLSGRLQSLAQTGAEGKLARYLLANAQDERLTCSATDLAKRLGMGRASLYRAFEALETSGLITRQGKTIHIPDPTGLAGVL